MTLKFWEWPHNRKVRHQAHLNNMALAFTLQLQEALRHTNIGVNATHHMTYGQKSPAPRPIRLTMNWIMPDGREHKQFVNLNGQTYWVESLPHYWNNEMPDRVE